MEDQQFINYQRIERAIQYLNQHFKEQPNLEHLANHINLSSFHFQQLFTDWAGVSPKKFIQYLSVEYAKDVLKEKQATLFNAAHKMGLSGTSRLHDLFITIEGMTPGEYKNGGVGLEINYSFTVIHFGKILSASTKKGLCYLVFVDDVDFSLNELKEKFPNAKYNLTKDVIQQNALNIFSLNWENLPEVKLHLKGTDFQIKVWQSLLKIPIGKLYSYGKIAESINKPKASRAVGTAIGDNPIAFLIPCHRVIQGNGMYGQYRWGRERKQILIGWEASHVETDEENGG